MAGLRVAAARATIGPNVSGWMLMGGTSTIGRRRTGDALVRPASVGLEHGSLGCVGDVHAVGS